MGSTHTTFPRSHHKPLGHSSEDGEAGVEPATFGIRTHCAANCATPQEDGDRALFGPASGSETGTGCQSVMDPVLAFSPVVTVAERRCYETNYAVTSYDGSFDAYGCSSRRSC